MSRGAPRSPRRGDLPVSVTLVIQLALLAVFSSALAAALLLVGAQFGSRDWLHLAWFAPVVLILDAIAAAARRRAARRLGEAGAIARLVENRARGIRPLRSILAACAIASLAVACARPQWGQTEEQVRRQGVDVYILLDTSRSMLAEDVKPSRLQRARLALNSLVDKLGGDRVALIAFAGDARITCPLTTDHGAVKMFLDLMEADVLQRPGTALADALTLVATTEQEDDGRGLAVVLITDGEDHEGGVDEAVKILSRRGVVIHALGIGTPEGAPIPVIENGRPGWLRDDAGQTVYSRLGLESLRAITSETGGTLALASGSEIELARIAAAISSMEQADLSVRQTRVRPDRPLPFLALAFVLLLLEFALPDGAPLLPGKGITRTERVAAAIAARRRARQAGEKEAA